MKSIVIFFSRADENWINDTIEVLEIGNVEYIVNIIKEMKPEFDIHKVITKNPYPFTYKDCCKLAKLETKFDGYPGLKNRIDNVDDYDLIYVASPLWYEHIPHALLNQLSTLNLKGKKIRLLISQEGSKLGKSLDDIKKDCEGAEVIDTYVIKGRTVDKEDLKQWLDKV